MTLVYEDCYASNDGVRIHYAAAGDAAAPLVVMIHGFPDYWGTWRHLMEDLPTYRTAALDLRGYNLSDQPANLEAYRYPELVGDVAAVIAAEGRSSATVIGHDWGASIAWNVAFRRPELVDRLVILSTPHPAGMIRELMSNPEQQKNSEYARKFQQEGSENALTLERLTGWITDEEALPAYREAFARSSFAGMMNYYRANYPRGIGPEMKVPPVLPRVKGPLLILHGLQDTALAAAGHSGTWDCCDEDTTIVMFPHSGHFVQQDARELANRTIRDWLDARREPAQRRQFKTENPFL